MVYAMSKIGVVCGLSSEAKAVRQAYPDPRLTIKISGAHSGRAEKRAAELCDEGVGLVMSVGISGGLLPALTPGDLVVGSKIVTHDGQNFECNERGLDLLTRSHKARNINPSIIYGADEIIVSAAQKSQLYRDSGAKSVDMESHGVARAARQAGVPFLAIRAIADPADRALPSAALNAVNEDGTTRILPTLINALKKPHQIGDLMRLGADSEKALKTLRNNLGGLFGVLLLGSNLL